MNILAASQRHSTFELGQCSEDVQHQSPRRGSGVDQGLVIDGLPPVCKSRR
jgi:hypothetical protein